MLNSVERYNVLLIKFYEEYKNCKVLFCFDWSGYWLEDCKINRLIFLVNKVIFFDLDLDGKKEKIIFLFFLIGFVLKINDK